MVFFQERLTEINTVAVGVTLTGLDITILRYVEIPCLALLLGGSFAAYGVVKKRVAEEAKTSLLVASTIFSHLAPLFTLW